MSPENPQSGKRGTKAGSRSGNETTFGTGLDPAEQLNPDTLNASAAERPGSALGATEFGTTGSTGLSQTARATEGQTAGILNQVREKAASQLNEQKARATDSLGNVAQAVRHSTQHLREQQYDTVAQFVERAADQIERFSNHLRERDLNDLVSEAQRFARQQPAVFIGSSFAAGMLAARFIKASRPTRSFDDRGYRGYGTTASGFDSSYNGGSIDRTSVGTGTPYGEGTSFGGGTSFDRSPSFDTPADRPGGVTGRGDL